LAFGSVLLRPRFAHFFRFPAMPQFHCSSPLLRPPSRKATVQGPPVLPGVVPTSPHVVILVNVGIPDNLSVCIQRKAPQHNVAGPCPALLGNFHMSVDCSIGASISTASCTWRRAPALINHEDAARRIISAQPACIGKLDRVVDGVFLSTGMVHPSDVDIFRKSGREESRFAPAPILSVNLA